MLSIAKKDQGSLFKEITEDEYFLTYSGTSGKDSLTQKIYFPVLWIFEPYYPKLPLRDLALLATAIFGKIMQNFALLFINKLHSDSKLVF